MAIPFVNDIDLLLNKVKNIVIESNSTALPAPTASTAGQIIYYTGASATNITGQTGTGFYISSSSTWTKVPYDLASIVANTGAGTYTFAAGVNLALTSGSIGGVVDPTNAQDVATKNYVDTQIIGMSSSAVTWKNSVHAASTAALASSVYDNGTAGVGSTLTASVNSIFPAVDGYTAVVGDRILVKDEATAANNGIYTVTNLGSGSTKWVLTRATDADAATDATYATVNIMNGTTQANYVFNQNTKLITVGTTAQTWVLIDNGKILADTTNYTTTLAGNVLAVKLDAARAVTTSGSNGIGININGTNGGLQITANALDVKVDTTGALTKNANGVAVLLQANKGISQNSTGLAAVVDTTKGLTLGAAGIGLALDTNPGLAQSASGIKVLLQSNSGLVLGASGLAAQVDGATLEINTGNIRVKDGGIALTKLAAAPAYSVLVNSTGASASPTTIQANAGVLPGSGETAVLKANSAGFSFDVSAKTMAQANGFVSGTPASFTHNLAAGTVYSIHAWLGNGEPLNATWTRSTNSASFTPSTAAAATYLNSVGITVIFREL